MSKLKDLSPELRHTSIRYCGNCKREYTFNTFIQNYPEPQHDKITKIWQNQEIRFYCSYCYFLEIIKKIKRNGR